MKLGTAITSCALTAPSHRPLPLRWNATASAMCSYEEEGQQFEGQRRDMAVAERTHEGAPANRGCKEAGWFTGESAIIVGRCQQVHQVRHLRQIQRRTILPKYPDPMRLTPQGKLPQNHVHERATSVRPVSPCQ